MRPVKPSAAPKSFAEFVGKSVLVGVTVNDHKDQFLHREQHFGRITAADDRKGFTISLEGQEAGQTLRLPPDLRSLEKAPPGVYRLKSTGEVIADPDFLSTWVKKQPPPGWEPPKS